MVNYRPIDILFGLFALLTAAGCGSPSPLNLVLVTFDTTRADHIGCYGNESISTPNLDRLASEGVLFAQARSAVPITAPSHSTILTGRFPLAHGVRDNGLYVLPDRNRTLAEILSEHGYATAAAIGSFPLTSRFGLNQGFDVYDETLNQLYEDYLGRRVMPKERMFFDERRAARVNEAVLPWLAERAGQPFFLWVHYFDPHQPFEPPPPYDSMYAANLYDGEIAYADESFGVLRAELERLGVDDRTVIVFTADHGEGLGEHREQTHSLVAYDTTLHVPLIIRHPGAVGARVVESMVATADIVPTVLDLLDLPPESDVQGISLAPFILNGVAVPAERAIYAETLSPRLMNGWSELRVLFKGSVKYIHGARPELYDLATDPAELVNLIDRDLERTAALRQILDDFVADHAVSGDDAVVAMDEETRLRLAALGYVQGAGDAPSKIVEGLVDGGIPPQDRVADVSNVSLVRQSLFEGRFVAAEDGARDLVERDPDNPSYRELLASALLANSKVDAAIEQVDYLANAGSDSMLSADLVRDLASALFARGEHDHALGLVKRDLERLPDPDGTYLLARFAATLGDEEAWRAALEKTLELDPEYPPARVDLAVAKAQSGQQAEAEAELRATIADQPYFEKAHFNLGTLLASSGDFARALPLFRRATELAPRYLKAHEAIVISQLQLGDRAAAVVSLADLEELAPSSPEYQRARDLLQ